MAELAPETLLAVEIARLLVYQPTEHGIFIDQETPTTLDRYTLISPLTTLSEGRADRIFRVQLAHRLTRADEQPAIDVARSHLHSVARIFDHAEHTPAILGISWAEEYSSTATSPASLWREIPSESARAPNRAAR